jgi:hypothetical protein
LITFRAVETGDRHQICEWILNDPGHAGMITPEFFLEGNETSSVYAVEDEKGTVMYIRQESEEKSTRLHMQFGPSKKRVLKALREGYAVVKADARRRGFTRIIFDSMSPALVRCLIEMGFVAECRAEI